MIWQQRVAELQSRFFKKYRSRFDFGKSVLLNYSITPLYLTNVLVKLPEIRVEETKLKVKYFCKIYTKFYNSDTNVPQHIMRETYKE